MKIFCIGRNYVNHAKELNNQVPTSPVLFLKPDTALLKNNQDFYYPEFSKDIHYELEVVLRIGKEGKKIEQKFAHKYVDGIGLGIDFTARDLQNELKSKGLPWEIAKGFDHSAPISEFINPEEFGDIQNLNFSLQKNGAQVQVGNTSDVLFRFDTLIAHISNYYTLKKGDLIFTGTPEGVGPVQIGDTLIGQLEDRVMLQVQIK
jgi:acylpyruvate hydrolase